MSLRSEVIRIWNEVSGNAKKISDLPSLPTNVDNADMFEVARSGTSYKATGSQLPSGAGGSWGTITGTLADQTDLQSALDAKQGKVIQVAASDESTALTTGTNKIKFRMPYAMTLTAVRASLSTAQTGGSILTVDINEGVTSILSTKLTIDNGEATSTTAATPPVISDTALADDAEISIDIDQVGDGTAKGLKITLIGT